MKKNITEKLLKTCVTLVMAINWLTGFTLCIGFDPIIAMIFMGSFLLFLVLMLIGWKEEYDWVL